MNYFQLTNRGNSAIKESLKIARLISAKNKILIPAEGGWLTYRDFPKKTGFETIELKCNKSRIDPEDLIQNVKKGAALLYSEPGGYFASQQLKLVYELCKENECLVILDVTGSFGRSSDYANYCDMMVASFGKDKPVNLGKGGVLCIKDYILSEIMPYKYEMPKFDANLVESLVVRLRKLPERYKMLDREVTKIKDDLQDYNVYWPNDESLVVVVGFSDEDEKQNIIKYCESNKYEYTICPRYIRTNENAVSIEVKRIRGGE